MRVFGRRHGHVEDGLRQHAFRQVVVPFEAPAVGRGDAAGPEQPFEGVLGVAPAPPAARAFLALQGGSGDRSTLGDLAMDLFYIGGVLASPFGEAEIHFVAARGPLHAPAHQRPGLDRQERGLVRPVFEDRALARDGGVIEQGHGVGAKPRIERHIVRAHHRADGIDLQQAGSRQHPGEVAAVRRADRFRVDEALRAERDAAGGGGRDFFLHAEAVLIIRECR